MSIEEDPNNEDMNRGETSDSLDEWLEGGDDDCDGGWDKQWESFVLDPSQEDTDDWEDED